MRKTLTTIAILNIAGAACAGEQMTVSFDALDADKDGALSQAEYVAAKSSKPFDSLDHNSDGKLDRAEFIGEKKQPETAEDK